MIIKEYDRYNPNVEANFPNDKDINMFLHNDFPTEYEDEDYYNLNTPEKCAKWHIDNGYTKDEMIYSLQVFGERPKRFIDDASDFYDKFTESLTEDFDDITIPEDERYEYIRSKSVLDSDGFYTDYTMYYDWEDDNYLFIFGDNDIYDPTNTEPDWECESEKEANEWFSNYEGFIDESCKIKESIDINDYIFKFYKDGYEIYTKKENGKAIWVAKKDNEEPFEISYEQVRGIYPIDKIDYSLQKKMRKALKIESSKNYKSHRKFVKESLRYFVTDDDYIPLKAQPENGYTKLQAVERAQREAEQASKLFKLPISDTAKWYHIMDSNNKILHDLDNAI